MSTNKRNSEPVGITQQNKDGALRALDELLSYAWQIRALVPYVPYPDRQGGTDVIPVPSHYRQCLKAREIRPVPEYVKYEEALAPDDVQRINDLGHWVNQNIVIRLYAILDAHHALGLLRALDNEDAEFLYRLRQEFAHGHGRPRPHLLKTFQELFPGVDTSDGENAGDFCLAIEQVLEPWVARLKESVERLPTVGEMSLDALRLDLRARLKKRPFEPFRIELVKGEPCEVRYPEMTLVADRYVVVGFPAPDDPAPVFCDWTRTIPFLAIAQVTTAASTASSA